MWTRSELKDKAKDLLRKNYLPLLVVSFILALVGYHSSNSNTTFRNRQDFVSYDFGSGLHFSPLLGSRWLIILGIILAILLLMILVGSAIQVGCMKIYIEATKKQHVEWYHMGSAFKNNWLTVIGTLFLTDLLILLGFLLLIVPGVILTYSYKMVPYILADHPELSVMEVMAMSREMTNGQKMDIFILDLSFIGWFLLGGLAFGIGTFFVYPYYDATLTELYHVLNRTPRDSDSGEMAY